MELNQPANQTIAVEAKYDLTSDREIGMQELRKLRGEMWDINVPFDGSTIQKVAASYGLTTRDAYINAIQWDAGLALVSLQRAVEEYGSIDHTRPYNSTCTGQSGACGSSFSASIDGGGAHAENVAPYRDMKFSMKQWGKDELPALKRANGELNHKNGHLYSFLNPEYRAVGMAGVITAEGDSAVARFASEPTRITSFPQGARTEVLYRPANTGETPSATPKKMSLAQKNSNGAPDTGVIPAVGSIDSETARILNIVISVISIIGFLVGLAQQFNLLPF